MERVTHDQFSWAVETHYRLEDGTLESEIEPFIAADGSVRNVDGSMWKAVAEVDPDAPPREVVQRTLILTVSAVAQAAQGIQLAVPVKEYRFGFAKALAGSLPAWERLAISMRGEAPPAQVVTAPASALGGVVLGGPGGPPLPPGLAERMRGRP